MWRFAASLPTKSARSLNEEAAHQAGRPPVAHPEGGGVGSGTDFAFGQHGQPANSAANQLRCSATNSANFTDGPPARLAGR